MGKPTMLQRAATLLFVGVTVALLSGCSSSQERAQSYYQHGVELLANGETDKAVLEFRNALKLEKNFVPALYSLADVEQQRGNFDQAVRLLTNVTELDTSHVKARIGLATIYLAGGDLEDAQKYTDQAYELAPKDPGVLALKAAVALKLDNRGDAVKLADQALEIDPQNIDALIVLASERLLAGDPKGALPFLDKGEKADERNIGVQLFKAKVLSALGDKAGVEGVFSKLVGLYPDNVSFRDALARWYLAAGQPDKGEQVLTDFAAARPDDTSAALAVISFIKQTKGDAAAEAELKSRIAKGGDVSALQLALADLLVGEKKSDDAIALLRQLADKSKNTDQRSAARLRLAQLMLANKDLAGASQQADAVLADDSKNVDALTVRAGVKIAKGDTTAAVQDLLAALSQQPDSWRVLAILADAYDREGSVELAEEQYAKAVRQQSMIRLSVSRMRSSSCATARPTRPSAS